MRYQALHRFHTIVVSHLSVYIHVYPFPMIICNIHRASPSPGEARWECKYNCPSNHRPRHQVPIFVRWPEAWWIQSFLHRTSAAGIEPQTSRSRIHTLYINLRLTDKWKYKKNVSTDVLPSKFVSSQEKNIWGLREYWQISVRALDAVLRVLAELLLMFGRNALRRICRKKNGSFVNVYNEKNELNGVLGCTVRPHWAFDNLG